ncbi:hypothetical protein MMC22_011090 [Lobaria immixta]|nr:hypothetical protein [Lobaria immixta]
MIGSKPSFASIAAMASPVQNGRGPPAREGTLGIKAHQSQPSLSSKSGVTESPSASQLHRELQNSMSRLVVREKSPSSSPPPDQDQGATVRAGQKSDDDQTQVSSSSTKPASLDGKSATSGNTFALDEKESLRPDDSASVKAAEEEDFYSGPASGAPSSRVGSEAGSRAFRDQFYEISERMGPSPHRSYPAGRRGIPGIEEEATPMSLPPLAAAIPTPVVLPRPEVITPIGAPFGFEYQEPDEKLFEALDSPKDRLFLLRLEQEVITFVKDSTPTPLSAINKLPISNDAVIQPAVKIMRRTGLNKDGQSVESGPNTTANSMAPSKAGSETGDDSLRGTGVVSPTDSVAAKDKASMTREEREAKYKETRERIFKGFEDSDNVEPNEVNELSNEVSRTSSVSEKKKTKKQRNHDDGFEARSKFNAYYPAMQYSVSTYDQTTNPAAYYNSYPSHPATMSPSGPLNTTMLQQAYSLGYQPLPNPPAFPAPMQPMPLMNGPSYNGQTSNSPAFPGYNQPAQYYQPIQQQMPIGQHSSAMSSPALSNNVPLSRPQSQMSDQQWPQNGFPYGYPRPRDQQQYFPPPMHDQVATSAMHSIPYQYGQLPFQSNVPGGRAQHPLPGSYTRQTFNPQTRAFVPGSGSMPHPVPYNGRSNESMARGQGPAFPNGSQSAPCGQYSDSYLQSALVSLPISLHQNQDPKSYNNRKSSSHTNGPQSPAPSSLSKWGTPAHLPPKPPPPETPSMPEAQHSLPTNVHAGVNVQPMGNGQPMPSFQNGVYSMPTASNQ